MTFEQFISYFHISLNNQQLEAVRIVQGPVLLLAVPGSGKTTVLVTRLGFMIYGCGISPESILMLTYTRAAARDMSERFTSIFGPEFAQRMHFRTINSICDRIIRYYADHVVGRRPFQLESNEKVLNGMIASIFQETEKTYPTENDIHNVRTMITYIKNMELPGDRLEGMNSNVDFDIARIYEIYQINMRNNRKMDYDDQMVYALNILKRSPETLAYFQKQFPYICVDEAQDTSKIQHTIISLLAGKTDNLFMVGDEDQSIYGFRAAYPEALLKFGQEHHNARILLMEENFRSTQKIVAAADRFISMNLFRYEKHMVCHGAPGSDIRNIEVKSRSAQYSYLLKVAQGVFSNQEATGYGRYDGNDGYNGNGGYIGYRWRTAVLYRNNESAIPLIDLLERNQVPYRMQNQDLLFFSHRTVLDIRNIIAFVYNGANAEAFMQIYYKIGLRITKKEAEAACQNSFTKQVPILAALEMYGNLGSYKLSRVRATRSNIRNMQTESASKALGRILKALNYQEYLNNSGISDDKIRILKILSYKEASLKTLDERLEWLKERIRTKEQDPGCPFILSTIHSSKGLEYERVYLIDCTDGIFPAEIPDTDRPDIDLRSDGLENMDELNDRGNMDGLNGLGNKGNLNDWKLYEEERRLFYVGVTRAKSEISVFSILNSEHTLIDELLGVKCQKKPKAQKKSKNNNQITASGTSGHNLQWKRMHTDSSKHKTEQGYEDFCKQLGSGITVIHKRFGEGIVVDVDDQHIQIYFEEMNEKTFNLHVLYENKLLVIR